MPAPPAYPKAVAGWPLVILTSLHPYFVISSLLTPSKSSQPKSLLPYRHFAPISPLAATLTKNRGEGYRLLLTRNPTRIPVLRCTATKELFVAQPFLAVRFHESRVTSHPLLAGGTLSGVN